MSDIEHHPEVLLDEEERQLGCQLLNKTSEVADISGEFEFLEMKYLTLIPREKGRSERRVRNETTPSPETTKEKKFNSPSFLYILALIIQQNPFSFSSNVLYKPCEFSESYYYIINNCQDYQGKL